MNNKPRDPRLFKRPARVELKTADDFRAFLQGQGEATAPANLAICRKMAKAVIADLESFDEPRELAKKVLEQADLVGALLDRGADQSVVHAAIILGSRFEMMRLSRNFGQTVDGRRRQNAPLMAGHVQPDRRAR